jgi:PAS domain S-box-containing protein
MIIARQDPWLAAIVEASADAIIIRNLDGIAIAWNSAAERLLGFKAAEVIGEQITIIVPPDRKDEEASVMARIGRGELAVCYETERCHKDGRVVRVSVAISAVRDANGSLVGTSSILRGLEAEPAPVQADHGLSALIHDATEALTAIIVYTSAGRRLATTLPGQEGVPAVLERIAEQSNRMIKTVQRMRRYVE